MPIAVKWAVLFVVGGLGLTVFVIGCVWGYKSYVLSRVGVTAPGRVVEVLELRSSEDKKRDREEGPASYHPVVEFKSAGEKQHRFTNKDGDSAGKYAAGASVSVLYDPANPANAQIADSTPLWHGPLVVGLLGLVFLAMGIGAFFVVQYSENEERLERENKVRRIKSEWNLLKGVVESVRMQQYASGDFYVVVVCSATLPDGITQERFEADPISISFNPEPLILGKSVEIYVHPEDKTRYAVMLEPVLAELQSATR